MSSASACARAALLGAVLLAPWALPASAQSPSPHKDRDDDSTETIVLSPFCITGGALGATVGGAKDVNLFRAGAGRGQIPLPESLTPEGLFSGYDLPLGGGTDSPGLFEVRAAAVPATFPVLPGVRYLAQLGLGSGLRAGTWHRPPLNFIAVVDQSGSMDGAPLALVRASLQSALDHLRDGDQFGLVLYGETAHVQLEPTPVNAGTRAALATTIAAITADGSTNLEAGLRLGYDVADRSAPGFAGVTRLMLFTDERPNVGDTSADGFMALATAGAARHIGLTTIGVGEQFDATLARRVANVAGGNLYFFADGPEMKRTFAEDFDTLVCELARELSVRVAPAPGFRIAGIFGVPGDLLRWDGDALVLDVATVFLSRRQGAIYFALAPTGADLPARDTATRAALATIDVSYRDLADDRLVRTSAGCPLLAAAGAPAGLRRGVMLVDEYLTMKQAVRAHHLADDQETAFRLVDGLLARLDRDDDPALAPERALVRDLNNTLALLSGHRGEIRLDTPHRTTPPLIGVWRRIDGGATTTADYVLVWPHSVIETLSFERGTAMVREARSFALDTALPDGARGALPAAVADGRELPWTTFAIASDRLTLTRPGRAPVIYVRAPYPKSGDSAEPAAATPAHLDPVNGLPDTVTGCALAIDPAE